ncbi:formate/nitrite transporter family protein [Spongorhabdus nitratireducens]
MNQTPQLVTNTVAPAEAAAYAVKVAVAKAAKSDRTPQVTFMLAILAGVYVAIAGMFYTVIFTGAGDMPYGMSKFIGGLGFSIALILVILTGAELFTSNTLLIMGRAEGKLTASQILRNWSIVFSGNFVGSLLMVALMIACGQYLFAHGEVGIKALYIAKSKMSHSFGQAIALGIICNLLVCLTYWMCICTTDTTTKILACMMGIAAFVGSGGEHVVANMYLLPIAVVIKNIAPDAFWHMTGYTAADFSHLTVANVFTVNLIPVLIGNILGGGVFVGMSQWYAHLKKHETPEEKAIAEASANLQRV